MKLNIQLFAGSCSIGTITETTDINTNQSTFTIPATLTTSGSTYNNDNAYMTLQWKYASGSDWTTISKKTFGIGQNSSKSKSWSLTLTHNADGTLENVNFRVKWYITSSTNGTSSTKTATPTTIPRASSIDGIAVSNIPSYPQIIWTPKSASFKYKVSYEYGNYYTISNLISPNTTNSYSYQGLQITEDIFSGVSSTTISNVIATLHTYQTSDLQSHIGSKTVNFEVTLNSNTKPSVTISNLAEADTTMQSLNWGVYVQNHSKLSFKTTTSAIGVQAPSVTTTANTNGQTLTSTGYNTHTFTTGLLSTSGSNTLSASATDSRTRTATATSQTYNVVAYSNPSISEAKAKRVNSSNVEDDNGTYLNITFKASITSVSNKNTNIFRVGYREKGTSTYTYKTFVNNDKTTYSLGNTYVDYRITDWTLNTNKQYDITFEAIDSFTTTTSLRQIETGYDLMNFNASGKAMAIGKVSEATGNNELLEIALPTKFTEDVNIDGKIDDVRSLEIKNSTPYIDFKYNFSASDYTSRIIEEESGQLTISNNAKVNNELIVGNIKTKNIFKPTLYYNGVKTNAARCIATLIDDTFNLKANENNYNYCYFSEVTNSGSSYNNNRGQLIPVEPGEKISFRLTNTSFNQNYITAYNSSLVSLGYTGYGQYSGTYTVPANAKYITFRFGLSPVTYGSTYSTKVQIEKNAYPTTYYPYQNLDNQEIYSTSEIKIGTWIDSKPLYRKVIEMGSLPNNTSKSVAHGLSNYVIRNISGAASNGTFQIPTSGFSDEVYIDASNVIWNTKVNRTSFSGYVILEYTKTTD